MANIVFRAAAASLWVWAYLSLAVVLAIAGTPAMLLARWGWALDATPSWAGGAASAVDTFVGLYFSVLAFFVFGLALMVVIPIVRAVYLLLRMKPHVGARPLRSWSTWNWYNQNGLLFLFNTVYGRFARLTNVYIWYLRAMGAKIGKHVVFNTQHVYDLDILSVGDRTVIGANASILGHVGEKGNLVRMPVAIGKNCTIGQYTNIFPGVTIGDNCHVGAMSLVPKGMRLDSNAIYGGVPVKKIRDLKPGDDVTSSDVSATTGTPHGKD